MAVIVLTDALVVAGATMLSSWANQVEVAAEVEEKDVTRFGSGGWRALTAGRRNGSIRVSGFNDYDNSTATITTPDEQGFSSLGANVPVTVSPTGADGDVGYFTNAFESTYQSFGQSGEPAPFTLDARSVSPMVRGTLLTPWNTARSATGSGTARQAGAVAANQYLYAALHVHAGTGGTLTVKVQSDDNAGMTSPADRVTFTATTGRTSQWATPVAGAITDTYWRASWTVTGGTTWKFVVVVGIAA